MKSATGSKQGDGKVCITDAIPGAIYILSVKYDSKSIVGSTYIGVPPVCQYSFECRINGNTVPGSKTSINLVPYCTIPSASTTDAGAPVISKQAPDELGAAISPNPAPGNFKLLVTSSTNEVVTVRVTDAFGRIVKQMNAIPYQPLYFGTELKQGMYFVEVIQGKKRTVVKAEKM